MLSQQLVKILRSLNYEEMEALNDFLYSPFFNKSKTIHKFWEAIRSYSPDFDNTSLTKEKLFTIVFPFKSYNYGTMKNLIHSFNGLLEEFLEIKFHKADKFQHDYNSLVYSIVKYYPELFKKRYSKVMKDFEKVSEGMEFHYLYKYQLIRLASSFLNMESKRNKTLVDQGDSLVYFFLIHLFQVSYNLKVYSLSENLEHKNNLVDEVFKLFDIDELLKKIKINSHRDYEVVNLYYYLYLCRREPDNDKYFSIFKKMLLSSQKYLHEFEFESMASGFIAFLNERSYMGKEGTQIETSEFYKHLILKKINIGNTEDRISLHYFGMILKHLFEAVDVEYAGIFYEKYVSMLPEKDKISMKNFYTAYLYYSKKEFNKALEFSSLIKAETEKFKLYIKEFQLKCYFELNEAEPFIYSLKAYRGLVYRSETINMNRKEYTKNFLNLTNLLFEYKVFKKVKLDEIKLNIRDNKMLNKEWIIQKLKEIESVK